VKVAVAGLGLIGGSFAKAYKKGGHTVYGFDLNRTMLGYARLAGAIDDELSDNCIGECELVIIALYPQDAIKYLEKNGPLISKRATVIDCCGTKREVCAAGFELAKKHGFTFVGGHPMAGKQYSGFKHSSANLFNRAAMILVPPRFDDIALVDRVKKLLEPCGFGTLTVTTAEKHDEMVAFTSQLAHVVSNAYIKSPTARAHKGFSAGSYKDLTRVAYLNETMWTELFLENRDNLIKELDFFIDSLGKYRDALHEGDEDTLKELLREGKKRKEEVDGAWQR
jgi:prephenate dehydrogenase